MIFEIFAHSTRLVCRKWYRMIQTHNPKYAHFKRSAHGLLIQRISGGRNKPAKFVTMQNDRVEISTQSYVIERQFWSGCNGLLLERANLDHTELYITNPLTKQQFSLPPFCMKKTHHWIIWTDIAYAPTSMQYKVFGTFYDRGFSYLKPDGIAILTVGVDKDWTRCVNIQHLSLKDKELLAQSPPLATQGFVHWVETDSEYVITMNVESEVITKTPVPSFLCHSGEARLFKLHKYLPMESYLSALIERAGSFEVWVMKPETGEWTKFLNFDLEAEKVVKHLSSCSAFDVNQLSGPSDFGLEPVGWLSPQEVLVCTVSVQKSRKCWLFIAYNVRTQEMDSFQLKGNSFCMLTHRNSLTWFDGC